MARKAKKSSQLFQIFREDLNSEVFCFHATDAENAKDKMNGWLHRHGMLRSDVRQNFVLNAVEKPQHANNIHDDFVM